MNSITFGNKVFFAGGVQFRDGNVLSDASNIDVYDASTNSWTQLVLNNNRVEHFLLGDSR